MKKRLFVLLALVITTAMVLAACQPQVVTQEVVVTQIVKETQIVQEVVEAEKGMLSIWGFYDLTNTEDSRAVQMKQTVESFQATTGIPVEYELVAWDQMATKLALAAQSGGDMPDLVMLGYEYVQGVVNAGALMDIGEYIKESFFYDDLNEFELALNEVNGERYAVGTFISGGNWYYDSTMLTDGWPTTREDWMTTCDTLAPEGKYLATFFAGRHSAAMAQGLAPLVWSAGGELFDAEGKPVFANEATVEAVQWWRDLLAKDCIPEVSFTGDWSGAEAPFVDKSAAGVRGGSWSYIYITGLKERFEAGEVMIGDPPGTADNQGYVFMNTETWAVTSGAQNVDNAIAFINFFFNPQVLAPWAKANYGLPATSEASANPIFDSQFYADTLDNLTRNGHKSDTSPFYNEVMDSLSATVQELVINPDKDIMSTLQATQDELLTKYY